MGIHYFISFHSDNIFSKSQFFQFSSYNNNTITPLSKNLKNVVYPSNLQRDIKKFVHNPIY